MLDLTEILKNVTEPLSKPIMKLIETVGSGVGKFYEPIGTIRQAKADTKADLIKLQGTIEAHDLIQRAQIRWDHVEGRRQRDLEKIISISASELPSDVSDEKVDPDWVNQFFDFAQDVSD